jgi:hypothetical protein
MKAYAAQKRFKVWQEETDIVNAKDALLKRITGFASLVQTELADIEKERAKQFDPPAAADVTDVLLDQEIRRWVGDQKGEADLSQFSPAKLQRFQLALARDPRPTDSEKANVAAWRSTQMSSKTPVVAELEARTTDAQWAQGILQAMRTFLDPEGALQAMRAAQAKAA